MGDLATMKKTIFEKITIVGVGLIGGSLGLAIQKRKLAKFMMGVVRRKSTLSAMFACKAVQGVTLSLEEDVRGADPVILCAPVSTILEQIRTLQPLLSKNTIVIDVASSKTLIDNAARNYLKGARFVGCHPMAGGTQTGVGHADVDLFEGAGCFMTNADDTVKKFWNKLGASVQYLTPKQHDAWVARAICKTLSC